MTKGIRFNRIPGGKVAEYQFRQKRDEEDERNENGRRKERRFKKSRRFYPVNSLFPLLENCFRQPFRKLINKNKNLGTIYNGESRVKIRENSRLVELNGIGGSLLFQSIKKSQRSYRACNFNDHEFDLWCLRLWHLNRFRLSKIFLQEKGKFSLQNLNWRSLKCDIKSENVILIHCIFCCKFIFLLFV